MDTRSLIPKIRRTAERKASGGDWLSKERVHGYGRVWLAF